jgi:hypothetical protein
MPRGRGWPKPGRPPVHVRYGRPIRAVEGENTLTFNSRITAAIATLLDEDSTDWYAASLRAAAEQTPASSGPDAADWRRVWASTAGPGESVSRTKAWRA